MSKKRSNENEGFYELFKSTFKLEGEGGYFEDEDEEDEDYNLIEDMMTNNQNYKYDNIPYNFTIPKKEVEDVINDPEESDITTKSNKLRKGLHLNKNSIKHRKDNKANDNLSFAINSGNREVPTINDNTLNMNNNTNITNNNQQNVIVNRSHISKPLNIDFIEIVKFFVKQFDIYLQLLIQNFLLSQDSKTKMRAYILIYNFYIERTKIINTFNLPHFDVSFSFCRIFNEGKKLMLYPQISFFQASILEILPLIVPFSERTFSKDQACAFLKEFIPFINQIYLPVNLKLSKNKIVIDDKSIINELKENNVEINNLELENSQKHENLLGRKKKKFGYMHDYLLMVGLLNHGKKNIDIIQKFWLESRTVQEIKHRLKNLTCLKAQENIVKKLKTSLESYLSKEEFILFLKAIQWFGVKKKWNAISKYFLPKRNGQYLEEIFNILVENNLIKFKCLDKSKKKKEFKNLTKIKGDNILIKYSQEFKNELDLTMNEINNLESKSFFTTLEKNYDKVLLEEETSESEAEKQHKRKNQEIDIHIKNSNKICYEQIVLDN